MRTVRELEKVLAEPSDSLMRDMAALDGDILILGVGGKMGPSLARLARNAIQQAEVDKEVIGVSRFSSGRLREELEADGIKTIAVDLLEEEQLKSLPEVKKRHLYGWHQVWDDGKRILSWAMNTYLPGRVAEKFRKSRIVAFFHWKCVSAHTPCARGSIGRLPAEPRWGVRPVMFGAGTRFGVLFTQVRDTRRPFPVELCH